MVRAYLAHTRTDEQGRKRIEVEFADADERLLWPEQLEPGEVELDVLWSSLNYKDALLLAGRPGISRRERIVPGIDVVGRVRRSASVRFAEGERVLLNGRGLGETRDGGLAERCRVPDDALLPLPEGMTARRAAVIGTAGFTAALAVLALVREVPAQAGEVLVTGAAGGVGSIAVALLADAGYRVVASSGRAETEEAYLRELGASRVTGRQEPGAEPGRPLQSVRWAGVVDVLGSLPLANAIAQTAPFGVVAACGLAAGADLPASVMPFILRGVTLRGINSVEASLDARREAYGLLGRLDGRLLDGLSETVELAEAGALAEPILRGEVRGRVAVRVLDRDPS